MKIISITDSYPPHQSGGYELRCKDVLEGLQKRGFEILMLTNQPDKNKSFELIDPPYVHRVLKLKPRRINVFSEVYFDNLEIKKIKGFIKAFKPDLLYLWHMQNFSNAILPFFSHLEIPMVYDEGGFGLIYFSRLQKRGLYFFKNEHDSAVKKLLKEIIKTFARVVSFGKIYPDWVWPENMKIYFNSYSALEHAQKLGVPVDNAPVIQSGVDMDLFPYKESGKMQSPVKIIVPGRIKRQKGSIDGIHLIDELRKINIPAQLLLIGEIESGDFYEFLIKTIKEKDLSDLVSIKGMVSQKALSYLYRTSDICLFPSNFKTGFSRVPLEAMASGCLVMTYGNEGSSESVIHEETGIILDEGDVTAAADWIGRLIETPSFYKEMVTKARHNVEQNFSLDVYLEKIDNFFQNSLHVLDK